MARTGGVRTNGKTIRDRHSSDDDIDMDAVIPKMKKVGYRNSEGLLILPDHYNDDDDDGG